MVGQDPDSMPGISLLSAITAGFMAKMIHQHVLWEFFGRCTFTNEWSLCSPYRDLKSTYKRGEQGSILFFPRLSLTTHSF